VGFCTGFTYVERFSRVSAARSSICLWIASGVCVVGFYTDFTLVEGFSEV